MVTPHAEGHRADWNAQGQEWQSLGGKEQMDNLKNVTCLSVLTDNDLVKDHFKENPECCHSLVRC